MTYVTCPQCGEEDALDFRVYTDADGDAGSPYGLSYFTVAEIQQQTCQCELTDDQMEAAERAAIEGNEYAIEQMMEPY